MRMEQFFSAALGLPAPWRVTRVDLIEEDELFEVHVALPSRTRLACPRCGRACPGYDARPRRWRHLDACGYQTWLLGEVPRMKCGEHGVVQLEVPWADVRSRFTGPFECSVIDWLQVAPIKAVAKLMRLSWSAVANIQSRAVRRGLARRGPLGATKLGVDETSFKKRHQYVTIVSNLEGSVVLDVQDDRTQAALEAFYKSLPSKALEDIEVVAMDMHRPYINATAIHVPRAEDKIAFDKFHVVKHFTDAVDKVRRAEHRELMADGDDTLKGSKYAWLTRPANMSHGMRVRFRALKDMALKVGRAWAVKEAVSTLWHYKTRTWALKGWMRLCDWASRTRLLPVVKAARTMRRHMLGILNAVVHGVTNASAEGINSQVQELKKRAHGYRNRTRFKEAIFFNLGGLDLYPEPSTAHTNR